MFANDVTQTAKYRKAFKHHLKTKQPSEVQLTPFRAEEKKYKSNFPPPDLSDVWDPWLFNENLREQATLGGTWNTGGTCPNVQVMKVDLYSGNHGSSGSRVAYTLSSHPGLVILPAYVSPEEQRSLIISSLANQAKAPNETNLDAHYEIPDEGIWAASQRNSSLSDGKSGLIHPRVRPFGGASGFRSEPPAKRTLVENTAGDALKPNYSPLPPPSPSSALTPTSPVQLLPKLRWANIGRSYHWGTKSYDFAKKLAPFPEDIRDMCRRVVRDIPWDVVWGRANPIPDDQWGAEGPDWSAWPESYEPDAGIVNFYQTKDTLMGHVDRSEVSSTTPLVSISLGNAAVFLIGGATRDVKPQAILLRSGDVVVMSGPRCRRAFHGVPRILDGTLPKYLSDGNGDWELFSDYMATTRININVRQVFPRGYMPPGAMLDSNTRADDGHENSSILIIHS